MAFGLFADPSGTPVALLSFPECVALEGMLPRKGPMQTYGRVSHIAVNERNALGDYIGFPNSSGGAVVCRHTGTLLGIHVGQ